MEGIEPRRMSGGETVFLPKGKESERFVKMTQVERDKVYESLRQLSGDLKFNREEISKTIWDEVASSELNYAFKKKASDLKGMPVSQAILEAATQVKEAGGLGSRAPRSVMYYCLDYLQNANENRTDTNNAGIKNIDEVKAEESVEIYKEGGRWKLRVLSPTGEVRLQGYLFPKEPGVVLAETPGAVLAETPGAVLAETPGAVLAETPGAVLAETPGAVLAETPGAVLAETPGAVLAETPGAVLAETPGAVLAETPGAVLAETPGAVLAETPGAVLAETPGAVLAGTEVVATQGRYDQIPEVTAERIEAARNALIQARQKIESEVSPALERQIKALEAQRPTPPTLPDYRAGQRAIEALLALPFDANDYLPLMSKESRLNPSADDGLFQITGGAQAELKKYMGWSLLDGEKKDPVKNAMGGILFLNWMRQRYVETPTYEGLSEHDKTLLTYAHFNKGPSHLRRLWTMIKPESYEAFETVLSAALQEQLTGTKVETIWETVHDPHYNVDYREYAGVKAYLELDRQRDPEEKLKKNLVINGMDTGMTCFQVGVMLRYARLIDGIHATCAGEPAPAEVAPAPLPEEEPVSWGEISVKPGDTLWKFSREYGVSTDYLKVKNGLSSETLAVGQTLKVPEVRTTAEPYLYRIPAMEKPWITVTPGKGFYTTLVSNEAYKTYLAEQIQLSNDQIEEVVIDFNRRYNPELTSLNEDASNIPLGAQIWVPNVDYFIAFYRGTFDTPEAPEAAPIQTLPLPEESPSLPLPPESLDGLSEALDNRTVGQYVKRVNGVWVRDLEAMKRGAERFPKRSFDSHPTWVDQAQNRTLFGGKVELEDVRFVVLHSTASNNSSATVNERKAHFVVEKDGTIRYVVPVKKEVDGKYKIPPHAGRSAWAGVSDLNEHSIGIEVVAPEGQGWTPEQYAALKELLPWLGGYFNLQKRDIVTHKQIAYSQYGRGRKSDPYDNPQTMYDKLGLPDNSDVLDLEVARGKISSNFSTIDAGQYGHRYGAWTGLEAAVQVQKNGGRTTPPRVPQASSERAAWKEQIRSLATIVPHTVVQGDTLYELARHYKTNVDVIMAYNDLTSTTLRIGQSLKIPVPNNGNGTR